jgi:hypothetical protein
MRETVGEVDGIEAQSDKRVPSAEKSAEKARDPNSRNVD